MIENILSPTHLLLILAVALIVLGPRRLPEAARGPGSAIRGFKVFDEQLTVTERLRQNAAAVSQGGEFWLSGADHHRRAAGRRRIAKSRRRCCTPRTSLSDHRSLD